MKYQKLIVAMNGIEVGSLFHDGHEPCYFNINSRG
jgi:hypothetical protein